MNYKIVLVIVVVLVLLLLVNILLYAKEYYVAKNGIDDNPGTFSSPWKTIAKANSQVQPGDIIYIRAGIYQETIKPDRSGTEGNYITYRNYQDEIVTISNVSYGANLKDKKYIKIDGITFDGGNESDPNMDYWIYGNNTSYCVIQNCNFRFCKGWSGIGLREGSHHNKILNNKAHHVGKPEPPAPNDEGEVIDIAYGSHYNLIEGNEASYGGHDVLRIRSSNYNIVRNNHFHNHWGRVGGLVAVERDRNEKSGIGWNVIENNIFSFAANYHNNVWPNPGLQIKQSNDIIRRNLFYNCYGSGFYIFCSGDDPLPTLNNKVYHNVFYNNGYNDREKNMHGMALYDWAGQDEMIANQVIKNNILYHNAKPGIEYSGTQASDHIVENNYEANPYFQDESNYDFNLQPNSPCIDAGTFLTKTDGSSSGTQIKLEDASYFCDGFGIVAGDLIQLEGQIQTARIVTINYDENIITIDKALSWNNGQGVSLPYDGTAPDIGSFEYLEDTTLNINASAYPSSGLVPLTVNFTANSTGGVKPFSYHWNFGDGEYSIEQNLTHTYTKTQVYAVTLFVIDNEGSQANDTLTINAFSSGNLINNTFEKGDDGWGDAIGNTNYERDNTTAFRGSYSMHVYATGAASKLSIGMNPEKWNINQYPFLSVAYKIPNNVPIGIFFNTDAGWVCLGGSKKYSSGSYPVNNSYTLVDDDCWHLITINVRNEINKVFSSVDSVLEFEWYTQNNGQQGDEFWFDEVMVLTDNNAPPTASISLSDPSPTKSGTVEVTLTTSKNVINVPTPFTFVQSDNSITSIVLSGVVPGTIFKGTFIVDETVAEGVGYFSLPTDILVDENNNEGNEITSGAYVKIDRTVPSKPQNLQGNFLR